MIPAPASAGGMTGVGLYGAQWCVVLSAIYFCNWLSGEERGRTVATGTGVDVIRSMVMIPERARLDQGM